MKVFIGKYNECPAKNRFRRSEDCAVIIGYPLSVLKKV
jgi:hypothetical protein